MISSIIENNEENPHTIDTPVSGEISDKLVSRDIVDTPVSGDIVDTPVSGGIVDTQAATTCFRTDVESEINFSSILVWCMTANPSKRDFSKQNCCDTWDELSPCCKCFWLMGFASCTVSTILFC